MSAIAAALIDSWQLEVAEQLKRRVAASAAVAATRAFTV